MKSLLIYVWGWVDEFDEKCDDEREGEEEREESKKTLNK